MHAHLYTRGAGWHLRECLQCCVALTPATLTTQSLDAGTAKSELSRRLNGLVGGKYFERLLTRFSVPEELFGPLSMRGEYTHANNCPLHFPHSCKPAGALLEHATCYCAPNYELQSFTK